MSSYEELEYFMESSGLEQGPEALVAVLLGISLVLGALLARCMLSKSQESGKGSETLQARKVLANVLNESLNSNSQQSMSEDGFVDIPLSEDSSSKQGQYVNTEVVASLKDTRYMQSTPSKPAKLVR